MVNPGFLDNPLVKEWLGDVEPSWTLLDYDSWRGLHYPPYDTDSRITLIHDSDLDFRRASPLTRTTIRLVDQCDASNGLKLTAKGNLSRAVVAEFINVLDWPAFDLEGTLALNKVINEADLWPLHFVRELAQEMKLVRRHKGYLRATKQGRRLVGGENGRELHAELFRTLLWHINLAYFDGFPIQGWAQSGIGVALWSVSVSAHAWSKRETLTRQCVAPVNGVLEERSWDVGSTIFEHRVLRPLVWLGLLEMKMITPSERPYSRSYLYRKSPAFDKTLAFDVELDGPVEVRH